jgi:Tfp pilus assembly protein PilF
LPLSYLLVPARKLGGARRYAGGLVLVTGAALVAVGGWSFVVRDIYSPPDARYGMDPAEQWRLMRQDPAGFLRILLVTAKRARLYGQEYLGSLGYLDTQLPGWLYLAEAVLLVAVCAAEFGPWSGVTARQALVAVGVVSLVTLSVLVIIHLTWDPVGSPYVVVQGRYFIPLGPLAGLALGRLLGGLAPGVLGRASRVVPAAAMVAVPVLLGAALFRVHDRYYVDSDLARAERCYTRGQDVLKKHGPPEEARALFAEALRLDPDHPGANYLLGYELRHTQPREAAEHFRAALRREPKHVPTLSHLAGVLARRGEYPEAIRLYRQVLELEPDNASAKGNLNQALQEQKATADFLQRLPAMFREMARAGNLLEERHQGTALHGLYLKPGRSRVAAQPASLGAPFVWRSPPPGGGEIRLDGPAVAGSPFFACSAGPLLGTRWVFVFPDRAVLLSDDEVSWFSQRPLAELTEAERARERDYRAGRGLRFPLAAPPD